MPIQAPPLAKVKSSKFLNAELAEYINKYSLANRIAFVNSKDGNEKLYKTYLAPKSPKRVDVGDKIGSLTSLATAKKWSAMTPFIKGLRESNTRAINTALDGFYNSVYGQSVLAVWKMGLDGAKAKTALSLVTVYQSGQGERVTWAAFQKVAKLAGESKARAALKEMGKPAPTKGPLSEQEEAERKLRLDREARRLQQYINDGLSYFDSAIKSVKKDGLPHDDRQVNRMFDSGRMRHSRAHELWNETILKARDFAKLYPKVASDKKKLDTQWAAYRTAIKEAESKPRKALVGDDD